MNLWLAPVIAWKKKNCDWQLLKYTGKQQLHYHTHSYQIYLKNKSRTTGKIKWDTHRVHDIWDKVRVHVKIHSPCSSACAWTASLQHSDQTPAPQPFHESHQLIVLFGENKCALTQKCGFGTVYILYAEFMHKNHQRSFHKLPNLDFTILQVGRLQRVCSTKMECCRHKAIP